MEVLWEIFRSSLSAGLEGLPDPMLKMQHRAREAAYKAAFPGATDSLLLVNGQVAGRVLVSRSELEHRVVDLAIMPHHRGRGLGTQLLRSLAEEASLAGKPLRLTVAAGNRALSLYRQIGFHVVSADEANLSLEIAALA